MTTKGYVENALPCCAASVVMPRHEMDPASEWRFLRVRTALDGCQYTRGCGPQRPDTPQREATHLRKYGVTV